MMRAIAIEAGALVPVMVPRPQPAANEVLIQVAYVGINRADLLQVQGKYAPPEGASPLPGLEVSGRIAEVGSAVIGWSIGEEVCALLSGGGYAEYVAVPAAQVLSVPVRLSLAEAATLPEAAATATMALAQEGRLQPGEHVLLHGGTSGLGILMAQVARAWGGAVFATASTDEKCTLLSQLGINAINHRAAPFAETLNKMTRDEGVDVIIDTLGGPQLETHMALLRRGGRLVNLALLEGPVAESVKLSRILLKHLHIAGATLRSRSADEKAVLVELVRRRIWPHVATGLIRPFVDTVFPLEQAEKAHARVEERLHIGKILLEVAPERAETAAQPQE